MATPLIKPTKIDLFLGFHISIWGKLFGGTVPPSKTLFGGIVPPNSTLFGGTPDSKKWYLIQWKVLDFVNAGTKVCKFTIMQVCKYTSMKIYKYIS